MGRNYSLNVVGRALENKYTSNEGLVEPPIINKRLTYI